MKVNILKAEGYKVEFLLEGATPAFANALRRIMISEVPTLSVEWVDFHENSSILYDEMIAHRLAMIPLKFDPSKFISTDDCKCEDGGCPLCQVVFAAEKTGPCIVHSSDLKSSNKSIKPTDPNFIIAELLKGQRLKFEAVARIGVGKKHAKWHAANASYQYFPEVNIKENDFRKYLKDVPSSAYVIQGKKMVIKDYARTDLIKKAVEQSENALEMAEDPTRFIFRIESISGLTPEYIVSTAAKILAEKAEDFKKQATKI